MGLFLGVHLALVAVLAALLFSSAPPLRAQTQSGITSPAPGSAVSGSVSIMGTAVGEPFARYELYFKQEPSGDESYIWFAGDTRQVINGQLGVWQTGDLVPGIYTLRMRVVRPDGNYGEFFAPNISVNQQPPTPTPTNTPNAPTPTPIPIATPTPVPQPTPVPVQVEQPDLGDTPTPEATDTPEQVALGPARGDNAPEAGAADGRTLTGELGTTLSLDHLRERFFTGVRWSAGIFLLVFAIFAVKRLAEWVWARVG